MQLKYANSAANDTIMAKCGMKYDTAYKKEVWEYQYLMYKNASNEKANYLKA